jgi:hypothetical protein
MEMTPTVPVERIRRRHDASARAWIPEGGRISDPGYDRSPSQPDALQPVLSIRACVERAEVPSFIRDALGEIRVHIEDHHIEVQGSPFSICHPTSRHRVDVEAGWPVGQAVGTDQISAGSLPSGLASRSRDHVAWEDAASLA